MHFGVAYLVTFHFCWAGLSLTARPSVVVRQRRQPLPGGGGVAVIGRRVVPQRQRTALRPAYDLRLALVALIGEAQR